MNRSCPSSVLVVAAFSALLSLPGHAQPLQIPGEDESAEAASAAARATSVEIRDFPTNLKIVEGGSPLQVPILLDRESGNGGTVDIVVRPEQPRNMPYTDLHISDPALGPDQRRTDLTLRLAIGNRPLKRHSRRFVVRAENGRTVSEKTLTVRVEPVDAPDIYLLAGQSNMVGTTLKAHEVADPEDAKYAPLDSPHPRVKQLNVSFNNPGDFQSLEDFRSLSNSLASPSFTLAMDPLHHSLRNGLSTKPDTTIGPGLSFAKRAVDLTERDVILVPAAWGGSGFCASSRNPVRSWNPDPRPESRFGGTGLFDRALVRVNYTIEQTGGILRGILWNQGRRDSYNDECTRLYEENVTRLIQAFRGRVRQDRRGPVARGASSDVPFIGATMSRGKDSRRDFSNPNAREIAVDDVYRNIADTVSYADYVNMDDIKPPRYPCGDGSCAHFGGRGYRIMGQRYYDALMRVFDRGRIDRDSGENDSSLNRNRPSGLVSGALYRWDGRNWLYRPGEVCKYRGGESAVPAANRLDGDRSGARYLALRAEISGRSIPDCPADVRIDSGGSDGGGGSSSPPPSGSSALVSGALYRWDGRNWLYRPGEVCKYRGGESAVPAANRLDGDRSGVRYLALRAEISGRSIPDCPPGTAVDAGEGAARTGAADPTRASLEDSGLVPGTLYRWDGRNFLYDPDGTCRKPGPRSDVDPANDLDLDRGSPRYTAMRPIVKASDGRRCQ